MPISFNEEKRIFKLDSATSSYIFYVFRDEHLVHLYYGARIPDDNVVDLKLRQNGCASFSPMVHGIDDGCHAPDMTPFEYPTTGVGDYRLTAYSTKSAEGNTVCDLFYKDHRIYPGKPPLPGLPATYANDDGEATTLEVDLADPVTGALVTLVYTVFENNGAITRSVRITNTSDREFLIENAASACVNLQLGEYDIINTYGQHGRECNLSRTPLGHMTQSIRSTRGASGHSHNPFVLVPRRTTTEDAGDCYGFVFVYSGNFDISCDADFFNAARVTVGINPETFEWHLAPGETFTVPETIMVFSEDGVGGVSRELHRLIAHNLIRGKWRDERRPILINSWEAVCFDVNEDTLIAFAEKAATLGIEMLVMDDGWFGHHRGWNLTSLGDWFVNPEKLPHGLSYLIDRVKEAGLKFGIWYEPEMVCEDSDMYRAHPEWALQTAGRPQSNARVQYQLDMSRPEVLENVWQQMYDVLSTNDIAYVKWDANRNFSEASSTYLDADHQGELAHRYMLGTYELMERLVSTFPDLLLETCSGGGGRFDAGMLYYSPQIWASDDTCALDRLTIQFGTSMAYPAASIGSHVSFAHRAPFATKAAVAEWGTFGYELDPRKLTDEDCDEVRREIAEYKRNWETIHKGELYRLIYPQESKERAVWSFVSADRSEALLYLVTITKPIETCFTVKLRGLDPDKYYREEKSGWVFSGALLMKAGYNMSFCRQNTADATVIRFTEVKD